MASCIGLAPTPYASGEDHIEQGITKAGNKRVRALMVELAWTHLRFQPDSQMSRWFNERFAHGGKRMRRIGLWRWPGGWPLRCGATWSTG